MTKLHSSTANDTAPVFSPDGKQVVFTSDRAGRPRLHLLDVARGTVSRLSDVDILWSRPSWSSDGRRILFSGKTAEFEDVYLIHSDGSGQIRLTRGAEGLR